MFQVLQLLQLIAIQLIQLIQPILVPLCFVAAWGLIVLVGWNLVAATRDSVQRAKVMHQIPCADCRYFTNNHLLKCPLHPKIALSEDAINCGDYESSGAALE
jgi:hypothetical protein